ncbi:MAG TPA: hypothetical protein VJ570_02815 [Holophagaceae bacterium]|nr:hypothetical protein [Holophagaceae bacterium]
MLHRLRSSIHVTNVLVQVCATTVGLFLALGLDHWKTQRAHQADARQARAAILEELKLNQVELRREIDRTRDSLKALQPLMARTLKGEHVEMGSHNHLGFSLATLRSAAWETSLATQSLSHMEPWRVGHISEAFSMQKDLEQLHRSMLNQVPTMSRLLMSREPDRDPAFRADLSTLITFYEVDLGSARDTLKSYEAAMAACLDGAAR